MFDRPRNQEQNLTDAFLVLTAAALDKESGSEEQNLAVNYMNNWLVRKKLATVPQVTEGLIALSGILLNELAALKNENSLSVLRNLKEKHGIGA